MNTRKVKKAAENDADNNKNKGKKIKIDAVQDPLWPLKSQILDQILDTFEQELGKILEQDHQESLDSKDGIIDITKEKLRSLFSELNNDELDVGIIDENDFFLQQNFKVDLKYSDC